MGTTEEESDDAVDLHGVRAGESGASTLELAVENRMEEVESVHQAFEAFSTDGELPPEARRRIQLVLDELLSNVICYGYDDDEKHFIDLRFELAADRIVLHIVDDGCPFNILQHPPPDLSQDLEERGVGGLGIHLVVSIMDEITYTRDGDQNVLVLTKRLTDPKSNAPADPKSNAPENQP